MTILGRGRTAVKRLPLFAELAGSNIRTAAGVTALGPPPVRVEFAADRNSDLTEAQLVRAIKAHIERGDKAQDKANQHYISAGQHLAKLKEMSPDQATFLATVKEKIGLGKSRTYELLQIADGRKTVEGVRAETANRQARRKLSVTNGQDCEPGTVIEPGTPVPAMSMPAIEAALEREFEETIAPPVILAKLRAAEIKIVGLASEIEELKTENAELRRQLEVFKSPVRCEFVEDDGGRGAAGYGEASGDCVARAITIATGKPYGEVFEALKAAHASYVKRLGPGSYEERRRSEPIHNGCNEKVYGRYLRSLGWQYTRIKEHLCLRAGGLPSGRLIVSLNGHLVALIDGVIHDTYDSGGTGKRPVGGYWCAS
jgi:hypothetical protein